MRALLLILFLISIIISDRRPNQVIHVNAIQSFETAQKKIDILNPVIPKPKITSKQHLVISTDQESTGTRINAKAFVASSHFFLELPRPIASVHSEKDRVIFYHTILC